jgi:hypothetical protein
MFPYVAIQIYFKKTIYMSIEILGEHTTQYMFNSQR